MEVKNSRQNNYRNPIFWAFTLFQFRNSQKQVTLFSERSNLLRSRCRDLNVYFYFLRKMDKNEKEGFLNLVSSFSKSRNIRIGLVEKVKFRISINSCSIFEMFLLACLLSLPVAITTNSVPIPLYMDDMLNAGRTVYDKQSTPTQSLGEC